MQIALLPLDERPVNIRLASDVAAIAGVRVTTPPAPALPRMRAPGDVDALAAWLRDTCASPDVDAAVVSLEMLLHGGLIASRVDDDDLAVVLARLGSLRDVRSARPTLPVSAVTVVMRASDSYAADEEPAYWSRHGRELHALGADLHRRFLAEQALPGSDAAPWSGGRPVPDDVRLDFLRRRMRNHVANLAAIELASEGVVGPLLLTADDTAPRSAGSLEQVWLEHWAGALAGPDAVQLHAGADEVGTVLVARALGALEPGPVVVGVVCAAGDGLARTALYENAPVGRGVAAQLRAAGCTTAGAEDRPDAVLVVHAPDPGRGDWRGHLPAASDAAYDDARATAAQVRRALDAGADVGLADVRYANGADPVLLELLRDDGLLAALSAYGAWNTAGNTVGSVVAALRATVVGRRAGTFDPDAARRLLVHRVLEDWGYQAVVRTALAARADVAPPERDGDAERAYTELVRRELGALADETFPGTGLASVRLPWHRTFEVDFEVDFEVGPGAAGAARPTSGAAEVSA